MSEDLFAEAAATFATWERDRDLSGCCLVTRRGETLFEASWDSQTMPRGCRTPRRPGSGWRR